MVAARLMVMVTMKMMIDDDDDDGNGDDDDDNGNGGDGYNSDMHRWLGWKWHPLILTDSPFGSGQLCKYYPCHACLHIEFKGIKCDGADLI